MHIASAAAEKILKMEVLWQILEEIVGGAISAVVDLAAKKLQARRLGSRLVPRKD